MSEPNIDLARVCKEARETRGYNKEYMAENLRMSVRQVYRIEAGESAPSWKTLDKWLGVCGFKLSWHLERKW